MSEIIIAAEKRALYFGCWGRPGHYLHDAGVRAAGGWDPQRDMPGFPWTIGLLDTGLLKNGRHEDKEDGRVWWTCSGTPLWLAFYWWDNSVDRRGGSNSGFYVQGFGHLEPQAALDFACMTFPHVVARQRHKLVLQP